MLHVLSIDKVILNVPVSYISVKEWINKNDNECKARFIFLDSPVEIIENPPMVVGHHISARFIRNYRRSSKEAFVGIIPKAKVFGEFSNIIITPDNQVLLDVSREFGAEGGKKVENFSVFHKRLGMPKVQYAKGRIAVISTCGSNNFHHWNFDVLPRLHLLKRAGIFDEIDKFIIHYEGYNFQKEGLRKLNIVPDKIINPKHNSNFYIQAEVLYVPSLTEDLGTISPWVVSFLRNTFLINEKKPINSDRIFLSRKNVSTRKIINQEQVSEELMKRGYTEFVPEDFTMEEVAEYFSKAKSIVSVHGSGLSNLPFINENTKVLDIMDPYHQDAYYWMICNNRKAKYVALFSEGMHPDDNLDLVKNKINKDLYIDIDKFKQALDLISK
jgi:hypothetical protein